jgi:gas vesicle protein
VNDRSRMICGAALGAVCGAAAAYLFFTEGGRGVRDRLEPAIDDFRREFTRFQSTIAKVGDLANEGMRAMADFKAAHSDYPSTGGTSH